MGNMAWAGVTIGDWHHLSDGDTSQAVVKDVVWPNTAGRDVMIVGQKFDDATSETYRFAEEGVRLNRITGSSLSAVNTIVAALETARLATVVGTLTYYNGSTSISETNMKLAQFRTLGAVEYLLGADSSHAYCQQFEAVFTKYA